MEIIRHWRLKAQRYRLEGSVCPSCGEPMFPPRPICMKCHCAVQQRSDGSVFLELPAWMDSTGIESRITYEITDRMLE